MEDYKFSLISARLRPDLHEIFVAYKKRRELVGKTEENLVQICRQVSIVTEKIWESITKERRPLVDKCSKFEGKSWRDGYLPDFDRRAKREYLFQLCRELLSDRFLPSIKEKKLIPVSHLAELYADLKTVVALRWGRFHDCFGDKSEFPFKDDPEDRRREILSKCRRCRDGKDDEKAEVTGQPEIISRKVLQELVSQRQKKEPTLVGTAVEAQQVSSEGGNLYVEKSNISSQMSHNSSSGYLGESSDRNNSVAISANSSAAGLPYFVSAKRYVVEDYKVFGHPVPALNVTSFVQTAGIPDHTSNNLPAGIVTHMTFPQQGGLDAFHLGCTNPSNYYCGYNFNYNVGISAMPVAPFLQQPVEGAVDLHRMMIADHCANQQHIVAEQNMNPLNPLGFRHSTQFHHQPGQSFISTSAFSQVAHETSATPQDFENVDEEAIRQSIINENPSLRLNGLSYNSVTSVTLDSSPDRLSHDSQQPDQTDEGMDIEAQEFRNESTATGLRSRRRRRSASDLDEEPRRTPSRQIDHTYDGIDIPLTSKSLGSGFEILLSMGVSEWRRRLQMDTWQTSFVVSWMDNTCHSQVIWLSAAICLLALFFHSREYKVGTIFASLSLIPLVGCTIYYRWLQLLIFIGNIPIWWRLKRRVDLATGLNVPLLLIIAGLQLVWDPNWLLLLYFIVEQLINAIHRWIKTFPFLKLICFDGLVVASVFLVLRGLQCYSNINQLQHVQWNVLFQVNFDSILNMLRWAFTEFKSLLTEHNGCGTDIWTIVILMLTHSVRVNLLYWLVRVPSVFRRLVVGGDPIKPKAHFRLGMIMLFLFFLAFNTEIAYGADQVYNTTWDVLMWLGSTAFYALLHPGRLYYGAPTHPLELTSSRHFIGQSSLNALWRGIFLFQCRHVKQVMQTALIKNMRLYHFLSAQRNVLFVGLIIDLVKDVM